jgi:DNA polymerase I-like protein with 3'-5' exonuclease and polymerase domains
MNGNALFLGTEEDKAYLPHLKAMFRGVSTYVLTEPVAYLSLLSQYCTKRGVDRIVSTNTAILKQLLSKIGNHSATPSLSNYAGSTFTLSLAPGPDGKEKEAEVLFISPLKQLFTVPYGRFLASRYISKLVAPEEWITSTQFSWNLLTPANLPSAYASLAKAVAIAVDIETFKNPLSIRCIGYTGVFISSTGAITTESYVLPITDLFAVEWMRKLNDLPPAKIFQNGKYDNAYLLRYGAPIRNWLWDTAHQFHSYYSELPKDLAFLNAFFLRKVVYWKDLAETNDLHEYYKYNALDTWATANVWIAWILQAPDWAKRNYTLEFPLVFPCLLSEMTGLRRDGNALQETRAALDTQIAAKTSSLQKMLAAPGFNANSPVQVKSLLKVLGCGDIESTEEKELKKAAYRHPLNGRIVDAILDIRGLRKLVSTYLRTDDDAKKSGIHAGEGGSKEFKGRTLYALNPHGTDTGRLASSEHAFWCGFNIQNIPRGPEVKQTLRAEDGWYLAECDLEQAESRDTAHISGDLALIDAVSGTRDFHSVNASAFFGKPYDAIYDDVIGKTKDKKLRDIAKRVNHGANYNMGPAVLVDTMGLPAIYDAAATLSLPFKDPLEIAEYLLCVFHKTYTKLRGQIMFRSPKVRSFLGYSSNPPYRLYAPSTYYAAVAREISTSKILISRAFHHTPFNTATYTKENYIEQGDWTRYCFGKPEENKLDLNSYVAHPPQSLNARTLNEAFLRVFYDIALPNPETFRLHAQIHDSILFSYKAGYEHHAESVRKCMEIPTSVRDVSGVTRTFTVPAAVKAGIKQKDGTFKRAVYWSETE